MPTSAACAERPRSPRRSRGARRLTAATWCSGDGTRAGVRVAVAATTVVGVIAAIAPASVFGFEDGAPWDAIETDEGCAGCHFDAPPVAGSSALSVDGLPRWPAPGERSELTLRLVDPAMSVAGFLAVVQGNGAAAGSLQPVDERVETDGDRARSTAEGVAPTAAGATEWRIVWTLPDAPGDVLTLEVRANVGNGDLSPFGDRLHRQAWHWTAPDGWRPKGAAATPPQDAEPLAGPGEAAVARSTD